LDSPFANAESQKPIFRPNSFPNQRACPERSFLHPVYILAFLTITVEVAHKDYVHTDHVRINARTTGYKMLDLPFALVRYHKPHKTHNYHDFGDLCEIWDSQFESISWRNSTQVESHLVPLNRLAGKWSPGHLEGQNGMMVLRHPVH
jgi:hypothetical protein